MLDGTSSATATATMFFPGRVGREVEQGGEESSPFVYLFKFFLSGEKRVCKCNEGRGEEKRAKKETESPPPFFLLPAPFCLSGPGKKEKKLPEQSS